MFLAVSAFSTLLALPAAAQTSVYGSMAVAGDFNRWRPTPNMILVASNLWQSEFFISARSNRFKFVASNNWDVQFHEIDQTGNFQVPITGRVDSVGSGGSGDDITITNAEPGLYRFRFNDATWDYRVDLMYTIASGVNMVSNPSFERKGSDDEKAYHWQWGQPDSHGSYWEEGGNGTPRRRNWRSHSGEWEAAIEGKYWPGRDDFGGWWQEAPAIAGQTYIGSAWFWADANANTMWTARVMEIKIEFYDAAFKQLLVAVNQFQSINENWSKQTISAVAPVGTEWGRIVIASVGNGQHGALQFDDVEFRPITSRNQNFNLWGTFLNDGTNTFDDWVIFNGKATTVGARSGYCASLPWSPGVSNFIRSPQFLDGVGTITFWYRNWNADPNAEKYEPVSFLVQTSPDDATWTTIGAVTNISSQQYKAYSIFANFPGPYYMRIVHDSGTNRLLIDDLNVAVPADSPRYMDFNTWPDIDTNMGDSSYLDWIVTTGRVSEINAREGRGLLLPANGTLTNTLRTPLFPEGFSEISFYYARGTNGNGPAAFTIQSSPNGEDWTRIAHVSNITGTGYAQYKGYFYETNAAYVRICNVTNIQNEGSTLHVDEGFDGGLTPPIGWTFDKITSLYDSDANSGRSAPALKFESLSTAKVFTATLTHPTNLSFWLKGVGTGTNTHNIFRVETKVPAQAWATVTNISPLPTSGATYSYAIAQNVVSARFVYIKSVGNAALDDVIVQGLPLSAQPPQDLLIDNVSVDYPILLRTQNFNAWPKESSYGNYRLYGWEVNDGIIDDTDAYDVQSARMDNSPSSGQYIQSCFIPEGIGTLSFVYARLTTSGTANVYYQIQLSSNGVTWVSNDTINVTSTNWTTYQKYFDDTTNHYVRLFHISGGVRVAFDDISIAELSPRAHVILNSSHKPVPTAAGDPVYLQCSVVPRYGASVLSVTSYYRIGTSGAFTALSMAITDRVNYVTTTPVPGQPAGTMVQYYQRCDFTGPGSEYTSPIYSPAGGATAPHTYYVPRQPPGSVWINEINYLNYWNPFADTNEFVELCGPAGFDLSGWKIEFYMSLYNVSNIYTYYASYAIPNGTVLANDNNGFGFFVLGDIDVLNADMTLTNLFKWDDGESHISDGIYPSGVRIVNEGDGVEQSLSYRGYLDGFMYTPVEDPYYDESCEDCWTNALDPLSMQLTGTGSYCSGFAWTTNDYTPGAVNVGQTLVGGSSNVLPLADIEAYSWGPTMLSLMIPATNGWTPEVRYAAALTPEPPVWILISPRTVTTNAGIWTIQFNYPAGQNNCVFRIEAWK